jgi:hypothetical protein
MSLDIEEDFGMVNAIRVCFAKVIERQFLVVGLVL